MIVVLAIVGCGDPNEVQVVESPCDVPRISDERVEVFAEFDEPEDTPGAFPRRGNVFVCEVNGRVGCDSVYTFERPERVPLEVLCGEEKGTEGDWVAAYVRIEWE